MDVEWLFLPLALLFSSSLSLSSSPLSSSEVALSSKERLAGSLEPARSGGSIQKKHLEANPEKIVQQPESPADFVVLWLVRLFTIDGVNAPFTVLGRFNPRAAAPVLRDEALLICVTVGTVL